ncbi:MAG: zinc ribbon domain-containing protein [Micrococcaceae bacterium]
MSTCENCNNKLKPEAKFCPNCGTKVENTTVKENKKQKKSKDNNKKVSKTALSNNAKKPVNDNDLSSDKDIDKKPEKVDSSTSEEKSIAEGKTGENVKTVKVEKVDAKKSKDSDTAVKKENNKTSKIKILSEKLQHSSSKDKKKLFIAGGAAVALLAGGFGAYAASTDLFASRPDEVAKKCDVDDYANPEKNPNYTPSDTTADGPLKDITNKKKCILIQPSTEDTGSTVKIASVGDTTFIIKQKYGTQSSSTSSSSDDSNYMDTVTDITAIDSTNGKTKWVAKPISDRTRNPESDKGSFPEYNVFDVNGKKGLQIHYESQKAATATSATGETKDQYLSFFEHQEGKENIEPNKTASADYTSTNIFNPETGEITTQEAKTKKIDDQLTKPLENKIIAQVKAKMPDKAQEVFDSMNSSSSSDDFITLGPSSNSNYTPFIAMTSPYSESYSSMYGETAFYSSMYGETAFYSSGVWDNTNNKILWSKEGDKYFDDSSSVDADVKQLPLCVGILGDYCFSPTAEKIYDAKTGAEVPYEKMNPEKIDSPVKISSSVRATASLDSESSSSEDSNTDENLDLITSPDGKYVLIKTEKGYQAPGHKITSPTDGVTFKVIDNNGIAYGTGHNGEAVKFDIANNKMESLGQKHPLLPANNNDKVWVFSKDDNAPYMLVPVGK